MKVVRVINNNISVCVDRNSNEVVVFGKGIGFQKKPGEEIPLSSIERTYYKVNPDFLSTLTSISEDAIEIAVKTVDYCHLVLDYELNPNVVFTLADHIDFCVKRVKQNIHIKMPAVEGIEYLYEQEYDVGLFALRLIKRELQIVLPKQEADMIALHIINARAIVSTNPGKNHDAMVNEIVTIIENFWHIRIDRTSFNYSRFASHMNYLFLRAENQEFILSQNSDILEKLVEEYPETYRLANRVANYIEENLNSRLTDEEVLYIMLHINRISDRENAR